MRHAVSHRSADFELHIPTHWHREPLCHLIAHIVGKHHWLLRHRLARLEALEQQLGAARERTAFAPTLEMLHQLIRELGAHVQREEQVIFPYIAMLEENSGRKGNPPGAFFGSLLVVGEALKRNGKDLQALISRLELSISGGTESGARLRRELQTIRDELIPHLDLEQNFLFPRAAKLH